MPWAPNNLATKGALASFHQAMETVDPVFLRHAQITQSTSASETYVFPGFIPTPRQFLGNRQFQDARDFTFTLTNSEYELSMIVNRKSWEDDQVGLINARMAEMGEVWNSWKDSLFATLLTNGNVSGNNGFDGTTFHADTHATGTTGLVADNNIAGVAAVTTAITAAEFLTMTNTARSTFLGFTDDTARAGYNKVAVNNLRFIMTTGHGRGAFEAMNQVAYTGGSGATAEFGKFVAGVDIMPELTGGTEVYASALGSARKPFIYQERTPLEIIIKAGADDVAENNGVMVLTRQRYILTYGDFRRSLLITLA
jgi:phage major head subunit gpT-like protein